MNTGTDLAELREIFSRSKMRVWEDEYYCLKLEDWRGLEGGAAGPTFVMNDGDEITAIVRGPLSDNVRIKLGAPAVGPLRVIQFDPSRPFNAPGFLAAITERIAQIEVSVLVISTYSRDFVLVQADDLTRSVAQVSTLGFHFEKT